VFVVNRTILEAVQANLSVLDLERLVGMHDEEVSVLAVSTYLDAASIRIKKGKIIGALRSLDTGLVHVAASGMHRLRFALLATAIDLLNAEDETLKTASLLHAWETEPPATLSHRIGPVKLTASQRLKLWRANLDAVEGRALDLPEDLRMSEDSALRARTKVVMGNLALTQRKLVEAARLYKEAAVEDRTERGIGSTYAWCLLKLAAADGHRGGAWARMPVQMWNIWTRAFRTYKLDDHDQNLLFAKRFFLLAYACLGLGRPREAQILLDRAIQVAETWIAAGQTPFKSMDLRDVSVEPSWYQQAMQLKLDIEAHKHENVAEPTCWWSEFCANLQIDNC